MQNVFDIHSENKLINIIVDILLIFGAGSTLLFFANVIKNENRSLMMYVSIAVGFVMIINMMHIHRYTDKKKDNRTAYNIVMYMNVYLLILMLLVTYMTQTNLY